MLDTKADVLARARRTLSLSLRSMDAPERARVEALPTEQDDDILEDYFAEGLQLVADGSALMQGMMDVALVAGEHVYPLPASVGRIQRARLIRADGGVDRTLPPSDSREAVTVEAGVPTAYATRPVSDAASPDAGTLALYLDAVPDAGVVAETPTVRFLFFQSGAYDDAPLTGGTGAADVPTSTVLLAMLAQHTPLKVALARYVAGAWAADVTGAPDPTPALEAQIQQRGAPLSPDLGAPLPSG
jgi:hypothetical protein